MPEGAVVTFDVGVLLGLSWLDMLDGDAPVRSPYQQLATDVFGAVVDPNGAGLAAPLDDPVKASDHALGWQGKVYLCSPLLSGGITICSSVNRDFFMFHLQGLERILLKSGGVLRSQVRNLDLVAAKVSFCSH